MIELKTTNLPQARTADLIEQSSGKELLIYDLRINKAYTLNETSTIVFRACGGKLSFEDLKRKHHYTDDLIHLALRKLKENNLIAGYEPADHFAGLSRREVIRKVGLGTMAALPVISSLVVPTAANAASGACGLTCTGAGNCAAPCPNCSGNGDCALSGFPTGQSCNNLGNSCTVSNPCVPGDGGIGTCAYTGANCAPGTSCPPVSGTCTGGGICS